ncbi:MAG: 50S ribosomal protein L4 [Candidatus Rokuibacteriota bacterium]
MPSVSVIDRTGKARETLELEAAVFAAPVNVPLLHQAVVRELAGRRAGTHATKGRSDVSGGGKKPWRQKGTGRARQGSIRATQWKGGGKPFGPTPRSYAQPMPRQARRAAMRVALSDKLATGRLTVVDEMRLDQPKTRAILALLRELGLPAGSTLLVVASLTEAVDRGSRNVPWLRVARPGQVSVAEVLRHENLVFEREALVRLQEALTS